MNKAIPEGDPLDRERYEAVIKEFEAPAREDERNRILRGLTGLTLYCDLSKPGELPAPSGEQPGIYFSRADVEALVRGEEG